MRNILFVFVICFSFLLSAECSRQNAGNVLRPGTGLGHVVFVNAQARLDHREIVSVAKRISESAELEVNAIVAKDTDPQTLLKTANAQAVVVIRDNATDPAMLIAPEDRWAIVNVAKLVGDLPSERAKQKFFVPRMRPYRSFFCHLPRLSPPLRRARQRPLNQPEPKHSHPRQNQPHGCENCDVC